MRRRSSGFSLLEVLVAFVIAALALGVLYKGALGGLLSARVATQYEEALSRATSRMAAIGHGSAIVPGEQSGDDGGGFRWRTRITVAETVAGVGAGAGARGVPVPTLYAVTVAIGWGQSGSTRVLQLDSQRAGFSAPSAP